jgi:glycosyltransferase involved in cell wall biosynthesis
MSDNVLVSIVTSTIGNPLLKEAVKSVQEQDYENIEHLIVIDGLEHEKATRKMLDEFEFKKTTHILCLPYPTGKNRYLGHRVYGSSTYLINGDYIAFLDEDNLFEPYHISSLIEEVLDNQLDWAYSLRKIVNQEGYFITNDDCQGLGQWPSFLTEFGFDHHIDTNCFFLKKSIAVHLAPLWYRRCVPESVNADMLLANQLLESYPNCGTTGLYSVRYRIGATTYSVKPGFFLRGNALKKAEYPDGYPWRQEVSIQNFKHELAERLSLREHNFILFVDWSKKTEEIAKDLENLVQTVLKNPNRSAITLLIFASNEYVETASTIFWDVIGKSIDQTVTISELPEIQLIPEMSRLEWKSLNSLLSGCIELCPESHRTIISRINIDLPMLTIESLNQNIDQPSFMTHSSPPAIEPTHSPEISHFLLLSHPGAGSHALKQVFNQHPHIYCAGEIFNADFKHNDADYLRKLVQFHYPNSGQSMFEGLQLLWMPEFLNLCAQDQQCAVVGVELFAPPYHTLQLYEIAALIDSGYKIIFLRRQNLLNATESLDKVHHIDETFFEVNTLPSNESSKIQVKQDYTTFKSWIEAQSYYLTFIEKELEKRSYKYLDLFYENLFNEHGGLSEQELTKIFAYLNVEPIDA